MFPENAETRSAQLPSISWPSNVPHPHYFVVQREVAMMRNHAMNEFYFVLCSVLQASTCTFPFRTQTVTRPILGSESY
jgi:hypothetical protein